MHILSTDREQVGVSSVSSSLISLKREKFPFHDNVSGTRKLLCVLEEKKIHSSIFSSGFVISSADSMVSFLWHSDSSLHFERIYSQLSDSIGHCQSVRQTFVGR